MMYNKEKRIMDIKYLVPKELIMEIKDEIIEIVGALFEDNVEKSIVGIVDLYEDLGMDSILFISAIVKLEEKFDIIIPDELILMENFSSVDKITKIVVEILNNKL